MPKNQTAIQEEIKQGLIREFKDQLPITPQLKQEIKKWITEQLIEYEEDGSINLPQD